MGLEDIRDQIYQDCPYTNFPAAVDNIARKSDSMTATLKIYADEYNQLMANNRLAEANAYVEAHPELKTIILTMEDYNRVRDGLVAIERVFNGYVGDYIAQVVKNKGDWSLSVQYKKYDVVNYPIDNGIDTAIYSFIGLPSDEAEEDIPVGTLPTDTDWWAPLTIRGSRGESGTGLSIRGAWDADVSYSVDDCVSYNNDIWYAVRANRGSIPVLESDDWTFWGSFYRPAGGIPKEELSSAVQNSLNLANTAVQALIFKNVSVSNWISDDTYNKFPYKAVIATHGVTVDDIPYVIFGMTEATSGKYAPICESGDGTVTIYSKLNSPITIPVIEVEVVGG